jgi:hypothetical protein
MGKPTGSLILQPPKLPYDEKKPVVCLDETYEPLVRRQLIGEAAAPLPVQRGQSAIYDYEYSLAGVSLYRLPSGRCPATGGTRGLKSFKVHHTPKHASWLNMAEIEIGVMGRQCLMRRIPTLTQMTHEVRSWVSERNACQHTVHWHFTTADARIKLQHLYPKI